MEKFIHKVKKFFTVKNTLIVIIGFLVLVIIVQNVHRAGGPGHGQYRGAGQTASASASRGGFGLPGMMGGGGGYQARRMMGD